MHLIVVVLPAPFWPSRPVELAGGDAEVDLVDRRGLPELAHQPARPHRRSGRGMVDGWVVGEGLSH